MLDASSTLVVLFFVLAISAVSYSWGYRVGREREEYRCWRIAMRMGHTDCAKKIDTIRQAESNTPDE